MFTIDLNLDSRIYLGMITLVIRPLRKAVSYGLGVALFKILPNFAEFALCGLHHFCEYANGVPRLRGPTVAALAAPYPKNAL